MPLKLIFAGTPEFAVPALQALIASAHTISAVYTQPDRPAGRGQQLTASPIKQLALSHHLPLYQPATLRTLQEQQQLQALQVDAMIVVAYGLLLPATILSAPRYGCFNIHASLLPRWRGAAPIQRAILAGDTETGITIMQMDEGLDTGAILHQVRCPINAEDTSAILYQRLAQLGAPALLKTLTDLEQGLLHPTSQDATQACYAAKITKEEAQLDWQQAAEILERQVRAFNPWPIAYTHLQKERLRIWDAQALPNPSPQETTPGTLLAIHKKSLDVATGRGILRLLEVQLPGTRRLSVADFLNARRNLLQSGVTIFT
ncbi:MAG: methionyl-tRNA formyltransferase [Gammaproteobacteria bacterium]